mmetsp:Transcript_52403/g.137186  ORF Transcript_52403/g.137186 Transcript_52403/m.137186 type:complete len:236 (+) Transcript_52403:665-1372(+)
MEAWPGPRRGVHRGDEDVGEDAAVGALRRAPDPRGGVPPRRGEHPVGLRAHGGAGHRAPHGPCQGGLHGLDQRGEAAAQVRRGVEPEACDAGAGRQVAAHRAGGRGRGGGGEHRAGGALPQPGPVLRGQQPALRAREGVRQVRRAGGGEGVGARGGRPLRRQDAAGPPGGRHPVQQDPGHDREGQVGGGAAGGGRLARGQQGLLRRSHRLRRRQGRHDDRARGDLRAGHVDPQVL